MTTMTVEEFRQQVVAQRGARRRGAPRYSDQLVEFALAHAHGALAAGRRVNAAAADLGLSFATLSAWLARAKSVSETRLRQVVVDETRVEPVVAARGLEVRTASGHVVRALSVVDAAALLRALE
jgi:hypothetical protein